MLNYQPQPLWSPVRAMLAAMVGCALLAAPVIAEAPSAPPTNRLSESGSPYLLQHAHNPVDWYPWGEEAVAKARQDNKPIFLSVGYSTCYWCHVAERTIYSDPAIAALMNKWFVNVKVDREERPDVDETYMLARQLLSGAGGWPNNVFLTPDLKPFFAGSYFPPADQDGATGFPTILKLIHEEWEKNPAKVSEIANELHHALARLRDGNREPASVLELVPGDWLANARQQVLPRRDSESAGFDGGGGTKFPQSPLLALLLADYRLTAKAESLHTVVSALDAMARGGIHDHLGGGMYRYSTEPTWSVPHFEKMLYDNAQLLSLYTDAYAITHQPLAREMARDIAGYLARRMTAPEGGFYTAEDADIDGKEGETYLWTRAEIEDVLGAEDANRFVAVYTLTPLPENPGGRGVLRIRQDFTATDEDRASLLRAIEDTAELRAKLLAVRERRPQPARDDKIVVALNGLAIAGLARAGTVFGEPSWIASAKRAGELLWRRAFDESSGSIRRHLYKGQAWGDGFLEDYALLGLGFVALSEATGEAVWSSRAAALASGILARFVKPKGAVFNALADATSIVPPVDLHDHDTPSGTSAAYALLARLGSAEPRYREAATQILAWMAPKLEAAPESWVSMVASAAELEGHARTTAGAPPLDSAAHIKAVAHGQSAADHDEIVVTLTIEPGYHVNANPASSDYLISTTVKPPFDGNAKITYPLGQSFKPKFLPEGISVYEGQASIKIELPRGSLAAAPHPPVNVEVQACNLEICLPPATLVVPLDKC